MITSKKMQLRSERLIVFCYILCAAICIANLFQQSILVSACFYMSFFAVFYLFVQSSSSSASHFSIEVELFMLIVLSIVNVVINQLVAGTEIVGFDYLKKLIMFLTTVVFFYCISYDVEITEKGKNIVLTIVLMIAAFYVYFYLTQKSQCMVFNGRISRYVTFGMTNPNLTGIYMLCMEAYCVISVFRFKRLWVKLIAVALSCTSASFLFLTNARNALIALILFFLITVVCTVRKKNFGKIITTALLWYPLIFCIIYLFIINNEKVIRVLSFLTSEGKTLDTRYNNWKNALLFFSKSPLIGAYCEISNGTGMSQMLNTHLDVLASYGVVVFALFMRFLTKVTAVASNSSKSIQNYIALAGFLACIIAGSGEAALVSGGTGIYILIGGLLLFTQNEHPEDGNWEGEAL